MAAHLRLMRLDCSLIFPLAADVELSCCATCGRVSFVRLIHVDGTYIDGQSSCASVGSETSFTITKSSRLTPHDSRSNRAGQVTCFRGMRSVDDILDVVIDVEGAVSGGSECTPVGASEGTSSDETCVYVVRVEELGRPFLVS